MKWSLCKHRGPMKLCLWFFPMTICRHAGMGKCRRHSAERNPYEGRRPGGMHANVLLQKMREESEKGIHCSHGMEEGGFSGCLNLMAWVRALYCNSVFIMHLWLMKVPIMVQTSYKMAKIQSLVDSEATVSFMHPRVVRMLKQGTKPPINKMTIQHRWHWE